ncbi:MAG: MATE family efflux transporter, partial [Bacteroidales bacterium]
SIGLFIIRLDGSPNYAMMCSAIAAVLNIILDYVFIFPLQGGLIGAALASSVSITVGGILVLLYMFRYSKTLKFYRLKMSIKSLRLTVRNIGSQIKVGSSALLGEVAIAMMILIGNYVFINMLGEEGVAAFSVACYCYPIVFMINNAVAQSAQPIISYNYGNGNYLRVKHAFTLSLRVALIGGILTSVVMIFFSRYVIAMFLDPHCEAYLIAIKGMPCFALGFMFFAFNIVCIGYYQSIERSKIAMMFAILRGFLFLAMTFWLLPKMWGNIGIWLSVPFAEILTAMIVGMVYLKHRLSAFKFSANPT